MTYAHVLPAVFRARQSRFTAIVLLEGQEVACHIMNTGRLAELLMPGAVAYVQRAANPNRSTHYDLIAVERDGRVFNIDSSAPNRLFGEYVARHGWLGEAVTVRREVPYGHARLDFLLQGADGPTYVEVKGVTLEQGGVALFPDAPTERGLRHVHTLMDCVASGCRAAAVFIVQMDGVSTFRPHEAMQPAFGAALRDAKAQGVQLLALGCHVAPDALCINRQLEILL